jgi:acetyl esterase/lipase
MMAGLLYLALSLVLLGCTLGLLFPGIYGRELQPVAALPAMVLSLFLPQFLLLGVVVTALCAWAGALSSPLGLAGLAVHLGCWALLLRFLYRMGGAYPNLDGIIVRDGDHPFGAELDDERRGLLKPGRITWSPGLLLRVPEAAGVDVVRNVVYREVGGVRLRVDVYRPRERRGPLPAALYIHGGAWIAGNRRQSTFMMYELAAAGWVVFAISYRRAPRFPLPAAIEDCKAALAWIRQHGLEYGTRGDEVVVLGGSAGGHLAAMVAMTPNDPRFQPGFEAADTRVRGAVVFYGVFDLELIVSEEPHRAATMFLERYVFRGRYRDAPDRYRLVQPVSHIPKEVPPILLVHGTQDALVPIDQSRRFYKKLKEAGGRKVHMMEVPLAVHAFEVVPTPLHQRSMRLILEFMETLRPSSPVVTPPAPEAPAA